MPARSYPNGARVAGLGAYAAQMAEMVMVVCAVSSVTTSDTHWFPDDENDAPSVTSGRGLVMWMPPPMIAEPAGQTTPPESSAGPPRSVLVELVIE